MDEFVLHRGEPPQLDVVNRDDRAYQLAIDNLVTAQDIPAGETVTIGFTTPDPETYTGELRDADSGEIVADVSVVVDAAGGGS